MIRKENDLYLPERVTPVNIIQYEDEDFYVLQKLYSDWMNLNERIKRIRDKMIDIVKAEKAFKEYLKEYDTESEKVALKVTHTYGVVKASEYLAKQLNLNEEDTNLSRLIALLHDIGKIGIPKEIINKPSRLTDEEYNIIKTLNS